MFDAGAEPISGTGFSISVVNDSSDRAGFDLWLLHDDTSYEKWVALAEEAQANFDAGGPPGSDADLRPYADPIDLQEAVDPGRSGNLVSSDSGPGTYALQCWRFPATGPMRLMAAGPVTVGQ